MEVQQKFFFVAVGIKMQKGVATLEMVLFLAVITLLACVAVPKISQVFDRVSLDYETKKFYSELRFVQAIDRSAKFETGTFSQKINSPSGDYVFLQISPEGKNYSVIRNGRQIRRKHILSKNISITYSNGLQKIYFDPDGTNSKSGHVTLQTRRGSIVQIYFDSVGRWRGVWENHQ